MLLEQEDDIESILEDKAMKAPGLATLKFLALLFLVPGVCGLVLAAGLSMQYLQSLPRSPEPTDLRMTPRTIHGEVVYETEQEDRRLTMTEDGSIIALGIGLGVGFLYFEKWGSLRSREAEDEPSEDLS